MAFSYRNYSESDDVKKYRENLANHEKNKVGEWTGGTYADSLKQAVDKINNREKFSYDLNNDMLYQQYKQQYINQGRLAMTDTVGQASALTGGYGNSYAVNAGNQAYQGYLQKLNGVVPELYQLALDKYNAEGSDLYNKASLYGSMYDKEYGEYRDKVSDWNAEYSRLSDKYNNERTYDYGQYSDAYNRAFGQYQQKVSEDQFAKNLALEYAQLAESRAARNQSAKIADLEAQLAAYKGIAEEKEKYSKWNGVQWYDYFDSILKTEGARAAITEYDKLREAGYIPEKYWQTAANASRASSTKTGSNKYVI